jgi:DNA (cytosine-5)-methyltransferase 1
MEAKQKHLFPDDSRADVGAGHSVISTAFGAGCDAPWPDELGTAMRKWTESKLRNPIRTLSLFSGAGGLDIGFHDAGFSMQAAVEIDSRFAESLSANSGENGYLEGMTVHRTDIRDFDPDSCGRIDFICGGPPCQSFSAAGRRAAGVAGTQDQRGSLFEEYVRILNRLRPKGFLFENVYGITGAEQGEAWKRILKAFADAGYNIYYRVLDAADYGVPQHRERMIIVGTQGYDYRFPAPTHGPDSTWGAPYYVAEHAVAGACVSEAERGSKIGGRFGHLLSEIPPGLNYSFFTEKMGHPSPIFAWRSKFSDFLYKADPATPVRTLKAQGGQYTGPFHWESRPFGILELKRLQTFPDSYTIVGRRQIAIHQLGNSVPPQLARLLAASILTQIFGVELPLPLSTLSPHQQLGFRQRKRCLTDVYQLKARNALSAAPPKAAAPTVSARLRRAFSVNLASDFSCSETKGGDIEVSVHCNSKKWTIDVASAKRPQQATTPAVNVVIESQPMSNWALGNTKVHLRCWAKSEPLFTCAWKIFEQELAQRGVKADLVQLCEYYQYEPRLKATLSYSKASRQFRWRVLSHVVSGNGTRQILKSDQLASAWCVSREEVLDAVRWLRTVGYEVRNRNTNSQIPKGCFLIPYPFPTLSPMSVQLRKSLDVVLP